MISILYALYFLYFTIYPIYPIYTLSHIIFPFFTVLGIEINFNDQLEQNFIFYLSKDGKKDLIEFAASQGVQIDN